MKTSLLVGAAGGVGTEIARGLVARGDHVIATVLNDAEAARLADTVPGVARIEQVNLGNANAALAKLREILSTVERLDRVAVSAAISPYGPMETCSLDVARTTFEINTLSHIAVYQATVALLRASKGRIVFVSSMAGRIGMPFIGSYTASKFALEGAANCMRAECGKWGVDISLVEPGGIRTPMVDHQLATIVGDIAALSESEDALYGSLYRGFQKAAGESHHTTSQPPEGVAATVFEAIDAEIPEPRYISGDDAKGLIDLSEKLPAREFDAILRQGFGF